MKRPHTPLLVRCQVAARQLSNDTECQAVMAASIPVAHRLTLLLERLAQALDCKRSELRLDHIPALVLRERLPSGKFKPDANDPDFLLYRTDHSHHIKTNVRGDGALRSDTSERMHQRRLAENRLRRAGKSRKPKVRIKSRSNWPPRGSRPFRNL